MIALLPLLMLGLVLNEADCQLAGGGLGGLGGLTNGGALDQQQLNSLLALLGLGQRIIGSSVGLATGSGLLGSGSGPLGSASGLLGSASGLLGSGSGGLGSGSGLPALDAAQSVLGLVPRVAGGLPLGALLAQLQKAPEQGQRNTRSLSVANPEELTEEQKEYLKRSMKV